MTTKAMSDHHPKLHATLHHLVRLLADDQEAIDVVPLLDATPFCFQIRVASSDLGKVIGKQGRTARCIRTIVAAYAARIGAPVIIDIVDAAEPGRRRLSAKT